MTPLVPFLSVTAAFLLVWTARRFGNATAAPRVVALVAIVLALPSIARSLAFDVLIGRTDTRVLTADWIAAHVKNDETVGQIPPVLIYPDAGVSRPANVVTFDLDRKAFLSARGETVVPDWMVVPTSPLGAYTVSADELEAIGNTGYIRDTSIVASHGVEMPEWFDQQDPFFMPYTTFTMRDRPGPEIQIFRRQR
jgi:hypothetical protein